MQSVSLRWRQPAEDNEVACVPRLFLVRLRQDDTRRVRTWKVDGQRRSVSLHGLLAASVYHVRIVAVDCDSRSRPSRWVTVRTSVQTAAQRQQRDQHHGERSTLFVCATCREASPHRLAYWAQAQGPKGLGDFLLTCYLTA